MSCKISPFVSTTGVISYSSVTCLAETTFPIGTVLVKVCSYAEGAASCHKKTPDLSGVLIIQRCRLRYIIKTPLVSFSKRYSIAIAKANAGCIAFTGLFVCCFIIICEFRIPYCLLFIQHVYLCRQFLFPYNLIKKLEKRLAAR